MKSLYRHKQNGDLFAIATDPQGNIISASGPLLFDNLNPRALSVSKAIKALESSEPDKHLLQTIENLKSEQKAAQEGMAKLLDSEYRAMQRELKRQGMTQ